MDNSDPLLPFGLAVIFFVGCAIAIPILRGSRDIPTAWNALLVGIITFTGLGSIEVKYFQGFAWSQLNWFEPTSQEVRWYMVATTAFIVTLLAAYYLNGPAKRFAQKRLRQWPEFSAPLTFFVIGYCVVMIAASIVCKNITFVAPLTLNLALIGAPAGCVFSFCLWYRNRYNLLWLALFIAVFLSSAMYVMLFSGGRRPLLSLCLGPFLCLYWNVARYWSRSKLFLVLGLALVMMIGVGSFYSKFRWYSAGKHERRSASGLMQQIKKAQGEGDIFRSVFRGGLGVFFFEGNGAFALLTERWVAQGVLDPIPLNTLRCLITYPIPRKIWPGKPEVVGIVIVRDAAHIPGTNWGLGIAGQGAYEGGIYALMIYAFLIAIGIRLLDEPLLLQPSNPFLLYIHATVLPNVAGIPRGDLASFVKEVAQGVLFAVLLGFVCRLLFRSQPNSHPAPSGRVRPQYARFPG